MACNDVYLMMLHDPYQGPDHTIPINATIVHALTLLNTSIPQPDGGRIYRCLTEFPVRRPGCIVPISTLTFELDGGGLWPQVGNWELVVSKLVALARAKGCDAISLGLNPLTSTLLANGPETTNVLHFEDGSTREAGPPERESEIQKIQNHVSALAAQAAFWPGDNLVSVPVEPRVIPYQPAVRSRDRTRTPR